MSHSEQGQGKGHFSTLRRLRRMLGIALGLFLAVAVSCLPPPAGLDGNAMRVMGIFLCAVVFWALNVAPAYVTAFLMCISWSAVTDIEFSEVFSTFSTTTWWLIVGALGVGLAVLKSGLLKRAALFCIRLFPKSYPGQIAALLCTGTVLSPLLPSTLAKMSIVGPMSIQIGETIGLRRKTKPMAGLFCAAYVGYALTGPVFLSASFMAYIVLGVLPDAVAEQFTWMTWFISMIPYGIVLLVGSFLFLSLYYHPKEALHVSCDELQAQAQKLGPMESKEKLALVILLATIALWITESIHGISSAVVAIGALSLFIATGILPSDEFCREMNWGMILFTGCVICVSNVFFRVGLDTWLLSLLSPFLTLDVDHILLFFVVSVVAIYITRFLIVEMTTATTLFTVLMTPILSSAGINPWIAGIISYTSVYTWNTIYQNSNYLVAYSSAGGDETLRFSDTVPMSLAYMLINIAGLIACIPLWQFLGYIP